MNRQETTYTTEQLHNADALINLLDTIPETRREIVVLMALSYIRGMETQEGISSQIVENSVK